MANSICLAFPRIDPRFVEIAFDGGPLPEVLVSQPVAPVSEQGRFFVEDFFKAQVPTH